MNEKNNKIIEKKDILTFDLKIKKLDQENQEKIIKFKNKTITLGKEEVLPGIDENIVGIDLSEDKIFEFNFEINKETNIFEEKIESGSYVFSFKVRDIIKHNSREKIDMSKIKSEQNDKQKIKELEEIKENLLSKIEKLELEKQLAEQVFKAKAEEMAKNAATKVEILKEEIKNKAKEDVDYKTKFATQKLVDDLLSPLNNLYVAVEAGAKANDPNVAAYVKGFKMLTSQIFNTLEMNGVSIIEPKEGDEFNPEIHHAQEVVEDQRFKKDQITKLISRGYKLHDRVLKPAIVIVVK